jgi:hypothetical protein
MKITQKLLIVLLLGMSISSFLAFTIPKGWMFRADASDCYKIGVEKSEVLGNIATLKSICKSNADMGNLMQVCDASKYLGKRVRMTGYLKTKDLTRWAGMWFRIDGRDNGKMLGFDNMYDRSLKGTNDWTKCEIVLDVPKEAAQLAFGFMLIGKGQIWVDRVKFEEVDNSVSVTKTMEESFYPKEPSNLDFNK